MVSKLESHRNDYRFLDIARISIVAERIQLYWDIYGIPLADPRTSWPLQKPRPGGLVGIKHLVIQDPTSSPPGTSSRKFSKEGSD